MEIIIPFGNERKAINFDLPQENVIVAQSRNPTTDMNWYDVVSKVIKEPIGTEAIGKQELNGKSVAIITDDWARPTPAYEAIPVILDELKSTGVSDSDITFITASGMHNPMTKEDLERKLGKDTVARYRCISHDGGDWDSLAFVGVSPQGTPIWVNRYVAEADYKIALGRIYLHEAYGYEGGYKIILPGVSGFDTITRDHSFNFSSDSVEGIHDNPSRREADAVGRIVGIDFIINVVVNSKGQPIKAFCGEPTAVHQMGIEYGDREVWGAEVSAKSDVTIASPGSGNTSEYYELSFHDIETLYRSARVTKESGAIICLSSKETSLDIKDANEKADESLFSLSEHQFQAALSSLALSEIIRLHEKRNWNLSEREIQWRIKSLRGEFYRRRKINEIRKRHVILTPDPNSALQGIITRKGRDISITIMPECRTTLAKEKLYEARRDF